MEGNASDLGGRLHGDLILEREKAEIVAAVGETGKYERRDYITMAERNICVCV